MRPEWALKEELPEGYLPLNDLVMEDDNEWCKGGGSLCGLPALSRGQEPRAALGTLGR
jgi:hypothetical protein